MNSELKARWKHSDPNPNDRGLLLSAQIDQLCREGLIIASGYQRSHLRPASYTLTIGDEYIDSEGRSRRLTLNHDTFVFKKNSIVYVSAAEELDLPYYIVARFNLRVKWVYEGILLGTGPQIDPGFRGRLSCPLYNLTNLDIIIKRGQEFATIDFEKTTTFLPNYSEIDRETVLSKPAPGDCIDVDGKPYVLYRQKPLQTLEHHPSYVLTSSLAEMRKEVRTWRNIGIGVIIAFIALTVTLVGLGINIYRQAVENLQQIQQNRTSIQLLEQRVSQLTAPQAPANTPSPGGNNATGVGNNQSQPRGK